MQVPTILLIFLICFPFADPAKENIIEASIEKTLPILRFKLRGSSSLNRGEANLVVKVNIFETSLTFLNARALLDNLSDEAGKIEATSGQPMPLTDMVRRAIARNEEYIAGFENLFDSVSLKE